MAKEKCLSCGVETLYEFNTHIEYRTNYVVGMGQLCRICSNNNLKTQPHLLVPFHIIKDIPNDMELGKKIRQLYYAQKQES
jgi:hypothetical protein